MQVLQRTNFWCGVARGFAYKLIGVLNTEKRIERRNYW